MIKPPVGPVGWRCVSPESVAITRICQLEEARRRGESLLACARICNEEAIVVRPKEALVRRRYAERLSGKERNK